jgi:hypothetical protein
MTLGEYRQQVRDYCRKLSEGDLRNLYANAMRRLESGSAGKSKGEMDEIRAEEARDELERRGLTTE